MRTIALLVLASSSLLANEKKPPIDQTTPSCEKRTWTMTFSEGVGYRRDRQKLIDATDASVSYFHNLNTVQTTAHLQFAWDRILVTMAGDYGWLINGDLNTKSTFGKSTLKIGSGYSADCNAALGCRIKFWTFHNGSLSFIPYLGYLYSHWNVLPCGSATVDYSRPIQQDWFGYYAAGRIAFSWKDQWRIDFYYQYSPVDFRQTLERSIHNFTTSSGALVAADTVRERLSSHSDTTRTHLGGADISYRSLHHWQLGAHFIGASTWSDTAHTISHIKTNIYYPTIASMQTRARKNLSVQWVRYSLDFYGSYWF